MPIFLVCDNRTSFLSLTLTKWSLENQVIIKFLANYYLQGNEVVESTNKNLIMVIKQLSNENPMDLHMQLKYPLWKNRVRVKNALGTSPYFLIYG